MSTLVDLEDMIIQTLRTHLNLSHTEMTQPANLIRSDFVGSRLNDKPYVAVMSGFVNCLRLFKFSLTRPLDCFAISRGEPHRGASRRDGGEGIHRVKATLDKPFLII